MKKGNEFRILQIAKTKYDLFPTGAIEESECPDFIVSGPTGPIGLEVTQLWQRPVSSVTPQAVQAFREKAVRSAEKVYRQRGGAPVNVRVYFNPSYSENQRIGTFAETLAEFVHTNYRTDPVAHFSDASSLPVGIADITMEIPSTVEGTPWFAGGLASSEVATYESLATTIFAKNTRIPSYQERLKEVWLLVGAEDVFTMSGNVCIPRGEIDSWSFRSEFARVLLVSGFYSEVREIRNSGT